jgi:hypothetical protein
MLRKYVLGFVALLLCMGVLIGAEVTGKITKVTPGSKKEPTVVEIGDKKFEVSGKTKVSKGGEELKKKDRAQALKGLKEGDEVTIVGDDGKASELKIK